MVAAADYRTMDGQELLSLDPNYDGRCPCARFMIEGTEIQTHCWRVDPWCNYSGIHYRGDRAVAETVKRAFDDMEWSEWQVVEGLL